MAQSEAFDAGPQRVDAADDLVAGNDRQHRVGQVAVHHMQVGAADTAGRHPDTDLAGAGLPIGQLGPLQGRAESVQDHRLHARLRFVAPGSILRGGAAARSPSPQSTVPAARPRLRGINAPRPAGHRVHRSHLAEEYVMVRASSPVGSKARPSGPPPRSSGDSLPEGPLQVWQKAQQTQLELLQGVGSDFALLVDESREAATMADQVGLQLAFAGEVLARLAQASTQWLGCLFDSQSQQARAIEAVCGDWLRWTLPAGGRDAEERPPAGDARPGGAAEQLFAYWQWPWTQGARIWQQAITHDLEAAKEASA